MPSPESLAAARARHQSALEAALPGVVTLAGTDYDVALILGPIERRQRSEGGGFINYQSLEVWLSKSLKPARPSQTGPITCENKVFQVRDITGDLTREISWHIKANRWID